MLTEDGDVAAPIYYVVNAKLDDKQTEFVLHALRITPIICVVITDIYQSTFALKLSNQTMNAHTLPQGHALAKKLANDTGQPVLLIGDADFLDAYYADGSREQVIPNA